MKVKESLFVDKFEEAMTSIGFWHESQFGFTKGIGREENLMKNVNWISKMLDEGHPVSEVFFDYSKAFDVAPRGLTLDKMNEVGIRGNIIPLDGQDHGWG